MNPNFYWPVYLNLEKELVELTSQIHIDDFQLNVYSIKLCDLIVRTVIEIESIAKELYYREGGAKPNDNKLYFDTDCLQFLEDNWKLSKKLINISGLGFHLTKAENIKLTPLLKSNKKGTNASTWQQAYQAIKHNRASNIKLGNIRNLIESLGALFILNLYYQDNVIKINNLNFDDILDYRMGSSIFSINIYHSKALGSKVETEIDLDEYLYILKPVNDSYFRTFVDHITYMNEIIFGPKELDIFRNRDFSFSLMNEIKKATRPTIYIENISNYSELYKDLNFEIVINKNFNSF